MRKFNLAQGLLDNISVLLLVAVLAAFGLKDGAFLGSENLLKIAIEASPIAIAASGMAFVLIAAGIDLSVGAVMLVAAALAVQMPQSGFSAPLSVCAMLLVGACIGSVNGVLVGGFRVVPLMATLATAYAARGLGLWATETGGKLPVQFEQFATATVYGIPAPLLLAGSVAFLAQIVLSWTPFGRQLHAIGNNCDNARKAGLDVGQMVAAAYIVCAVCAAAAALVALPPMPLSPSSGSGFSKELAVLAAAVLGGSSVYGGKGQAFPGALVA